MKLTLSWLKDHLKTDAPLSEIVERLTSIGLEVESVDDKAGLKPFVIAKVLTAQKHPDADKLQVIRATESRFRSYVARRMPARVWSAPSPRPAPTFPAST
jgi:hypothetical protein